MNKPARHWLILLLLAACTGAQAAEWQVVLLKPRDCDRCVYLEEILKRQGQLHQTVLRDAARGQVTARVVRRAGTELSAQEWTELRALPWFDESQWRRQAAKGSPQILLKRDELVVSAGDITDSANLRNARFPVPLLMPDGGRDVFSVRNAQAVFVNDLYLRSWNLDWFYQLALDPSILESRSDAAWIAGNSETLTPPLGGANVLLMSTASGAADNEIFNALRIEEIRDVLAPSLARDPGQLRIFYGGGPGRGANALEVRAGRIGLVRRDVADSNPFTPDAALRIFQSIRARPGSRNLLVLVGHGNPDGAGMWSSPTALSPAALRALHDHSSGDNVLVSGNCFGGVMARATSCGFFGARPDLIATGCQADAAEVAQSRDYLHMYFSSLRPEMRAAADADGDGDVSFAEAHWYASTEGDPRNVTYTSIDALADEYFDANPAALPKELAMREVQELATSAPAAEARALRRLTEGQNADSTLPLQDLAGQAARWRPGGSAPRPMLGQLTRRLLFQRQARTADTELARLQSCENRSVEAFLRP
jgi:hypothetical protein